MKYKNNETRAGYKTVSVLKDLTKDYIDAHIVDNKYVGKPEYLITYKSLTKYLEN